MPIGSEPTRQIVRIKTAEAAETKLEDEVDYFTHLKPIKPSD